MKAKTIKSVLRKKHNEFVESIKDEDVRKLVDKNSIITGGAIVSLLTNEEVNDFDYYFTNKETAVAVAKYYVDEFNKSNDYDARVEVEDESGRIKVFVQSEGIAGNPQDYEVDTDAEQSLESVFEDKPEEEEEEEYKPVFLSTNAISLTGKVQVVLRFYGDADEIHENYDFVHCTCFWRSEDGHLSLPRRALEAILTKELIYTGSKYPLCSIFRTKKFIQRGWHINAGQYLKMAFQLNELDLLDVDVLEEQLTGVDAAYFSMVIEHVRKKIDEDEDFKISTPYLIEVVNRIF